MKPRTRWLNLILMPVMAWGASAGYAMDGGNAGRADRWVSRANQPPRKIVVASSLGEFTGPVEERLAKVKEVANRAALEAGRKYAGRGVDLMVFTEFAIQRRSDGKAADQAVELKGEVLDSLGAVASEHHMWLVVPMTLRERARISNAAVLFNRAGGVAGIFRKVHPMVDDAGVFEGGVTPGNSYPVFDCDFGRLGVLICWDMGYDEVWDALAAGGAEIVALPTASPQTLRPSAEALRHHYYVVTSPPRDNASLYDPIGRPVARITEPGVLVHEIDLSYAILHWNERLHEGHALTERFGNKVGYEYSTREDTGIFWSNDPRTSIGEMVREFGLREMPMVMEQVEEAARKMRGDAK